MREAFISNLFQSPKKILLLINPRARSGDGCYHEMIAALQSAGHEVQLLSEEERKNDFRKLIQTYQNTTSFVIAGGGDGTINYLLPALVETQLPLIIYPLGTANLLARSFELKADTQQLLQLLKTGVIVPIDLGMVNGIYFINVCGLGISTEVNQHISPRLKKLTGALSFWLTGLKLRRSLRPFKIMLTVDDQAPVFSRTWQVTICNGKKYAAWMTIATDATYDDQTLHCLSTEVKKWWHGLRLLPCYLKGSYQEGMDVTLRAGQNIKIETKRPLRIDVDGDVQTHTPAQFEIRPQALKLLIPATFHL